MWIRRWLGAVSVVDCQCCFIEVVQFTFVCRSNLSEYRTKVTYSHEMIGGVESCAKWYLISAGDECTILSFRKLEFPIRL